MFGKYTYSTGIHISALTLIIWLVVQTDN